MSGAAEAADDRLHDACGVVGIWGVDAAAQAAYLALHALQHRGQESAGIATLHDGRHHAHRALGLVSEAFDAVRIAGLPGRAAVGHVRYATAGGGGLANAQPIAVRSALGPLAVAHNGNLTNALTLRAALEAEGSIFQTTSDTEVLVHLLARAREASFEARLRAALEQLQGAWSLTILTRDAVVGVRDPRGVRPLVLGRLEGGHVLASETCALAFLGATFIREIEPGEIVVLDDRGVTSLGRGAEVPRRACVFEHVYFARPDSRLFGRSVYAVRRALGSRLAEECPADADVAIPVPDSGVAAAIGYAERAGLPFAMGLVRSHYVGRTFIQPTAEGRQLGVRRKLAPVEEVIAGRRVVVLDDSLVRGTTSRQIVALLRAAGAREVHLRISSPPIAHPCFYGIDTPSRAELIAAVRDVAGIAAWLGCDSLGFLSRAGLLSVAGGCEPGEIEPGGRDVGFCDACFTGRYDIPLVDEGGECSSG